MPKVPVHNTKGETVGELDLKDEIFGVPVNEPLLHQVTVAYLANRRQGTAATKTRGEVRGGGRKPWRQKGLGRARHGSIRSPLWTGGGTVFGPKPRDYRLQIPKRMRRQALRSALSARVRDGELLVVDGLRLDAPKTQAVAEVLKNLGAERGALLVTGELDRPLILSARNLPRVRTMVARDLNALEVLNCHRLILTPDAVARVTEVLS